MLDAWTKAMRGLTELEFRRGVSKLNSFERPPSLPEFLKACRPEVNPLSAYYEAIEGVKSREQGEVGTWSHPAIYWASVRVSAHDLKNQTYSQVRGRWEMALAAELEKGHWEIIPAPLLQVAGPKNEKPSAKMVGEVMKRLKDETFVKPGSSLADGKSWARKILERHKAGDKTLSLIQIRFAREALDIGENDED